MMMAAAVVVVVLEICVNHSMSYTCSITEQAQLQLNKCTETKWKRRILLESHHARCICLCVCVSVYLMHYV